MDYGKLAYLKATDLESRLISTSSQPSFGIRYKQLKDIASGQTELLNIEGGGEMAIFIDSSESAQFFYNGILVGTGTNFFFKAQGSGVLSVSSTAKIARISIMVIGGVTASNEGGVLQADSTDNDIGYMLIDAGRVEAYISPLSKFSPVKVFEGAYLHGDICAYGNSYVFAVTDGGSIYLICTDGRKNRFGLLSEKVAISFDGYMFTISYIYSGKLYTFRLSEIEEELSYFDNIYFTDYVDDVKAVKKSAKTAFSSKGNCYIRDIEERTSCDDIMRITLKAEVT